MNDEIKSAYDIAIEKLAAIEEPTEDEKNTWKYVPDGEKLAAGYLKGEADLAAALDKYDAVGRPYVTRGAADVLLPGIKLPRTEAESASLALVTSGMRLLKTDTTALEELLGRLQQVFDHYSQTGAAQIAQAHDQLKQQMTARVQQALAQQVGAGANMTIDVEAQPEFQAEWHKVKAQLEGQYDRLIEEVRAQIRALD